MTVAFVGYDARQLFSHALLWGAAAIAEDAGVRDVRLGWTEGMSPWPRLHGTDLDPEALGEVVRAHATAHADPGSWVHAPLPSEPKRGLFSPRIGALADGAAWHRHEAARRDWLDRLGAARADLDLRFIASLGEPAYWGPVENKRTAIEDGASRLEMQPRNSGSEFVGSRLRPLAGVVSERAAAQIAAGLTGTSIRDQTGKGASDSRTATNLRPLGPTDDAAGWVALWGLSQTAVVARVRQMSRTATHRPPRGRGGGPGAFVVPVWEGWWTSARLRSILSSDLLADAAEAATTDPRRARLERYAVRGLIRVPIDVSGSNSAPERRAVTGSPW